MSEVPSFEFLSIVEQQGLLPTETLAELSAEAQRRKIDPATLVIQRGLLSPVQVEIIETLREPRNAIPGYEIESVLGHGGMGIVYRARQLNLNRIVALKTVLVSQAANPSMLARFEQEAQTVAKLVHPHIVGAYDFGRHAGRLFFAMEYVEGEDADHFARRQQPLSERVAWGLIRQAAAGLAHASELGIVHRDIKPANLLLVTPPKGYPLPSGMPMVKIADFGLALLTSEADERTKLTAEHTTVGSPHYMAPEQLHANKTIDHRADIYSLGATVFHLLTGRPPFDTLTLPQIIASKLSEPSPELACDRRDVSPEGLELIRAMMARDVTDRLGSYSELLRRIDALPVMIAADAATLDFRKLTSRSVPEVSTVRTDAAVTTVLPVLKSRSFRALLSIVAAIGVAVFVYWLGHNSNSSLVGHVPSGPTLVSTGWAVELFDGKSLNGWKTQNGFWVVNKDDEGGFVLAGTDGELMRPLVKSKDNRIVPIPHYRFVTTARLNKATAVEMQFNVQSNGTRNAVRLTNDQITLGQHAVGKSQFHAIGPATSTSVGADRLHELKLERQGTEWRVFVDDALIGTLPLAPEKELPEIRISAEGGPAWFADIVVEELATPSFEVRSK